MAFDREIAAITCFCEASSATPAERRAIIWVMKNRLHDQKRRFGLTIADVCLARYQFSEWLDDKADSANLHRAARALDDDPIMLDCLAAFDAVMAAPSRDDPTGGSCHYTDKTIDPPAWAAPPAVLALETEHFRFYRGVS